MLCGVVGKEIVWGSSGGLCVVVGEVYVGWCERVVCGVMEGLYGGLYDLVGEGCVSLCGMVEGVGIIGE